MSSGWCWRYCAKLVRLTCTRTRLPLAGGEGLPNVRRQDEPRGPRFEAGAVRRGGDEAGGRGGVAYARTHKLTQIQPGRDPLALTQVEIGLMTRQPHP